MIKIDNLVAWQDAAIEGFRREWECPNCGSRLLVKDHGAVWTTDESDFDCRVYRHEVRCSGDSWSPVAKVAKDAMKKHNKAFGAYSSHGFCDKVAKLFSDTDADVIDELRYDLATMTRNAQLHEDVLNGIVQLEAVLKCELINNGEENEL